MQAWRGDLGAIADRPSERGEAVEMERWAEMMLRATGAAERIAVAFCAFRMAMRGNISPHTAVAAMVAVNGGLCRRVVVEGAQPAGWRLEGQPFLAVVLRMEKEKKSS